MNRTTKTSLAEWAKKVASVSRGISTDAVLRNFRIQHDLMFNKNVSIAEILTTSSATLLVSALWALLPFSRGSVHLRSTDPSDINNPIINPRFFQIDFDWEYQIAVGQLAQTFWTKNPINKLVVGPVNPREQVLPLNSTRSQWISFIKSSCKPDSLSTGMNAELI